MSFDPSWKKHEQAMRSDDPVVARKATDAFLEERDKELQTSAKAREWEKNRKKEWARNKPEFAKRLHQKETEPLNKLKQSLKDGGAHSMNFTPGRGLLLIQLPELQEKTDTGIYLPDDHVELRNVGLCVDVGGPIAQEGLVVDAPCSPGDTILFKKGAGLEVTIKDGKYLLMYFSEYLGTFHD